ncbi:methyltransferase family protein [Frateuria aurantia]
MPPHPPFALATLMGVSMGLSELLLGLLRRSRQPRSDLDRGSLALFWVLIPVSIGLSQWVVTISPDWRVPGIWPRPAGLVLFIAGLGLRWYSILHLGRWFTVDVAIHAEQPLIDSGPYRRLRHPSYSGALLALIGMGLSTGHYAAMLLMWLPALPAFGYRIRVEEAALRQAFGARWVNYCRHTWRLLPGIY